MAKAIFSLSIIWHGAVERHQPGVDDVEDSRYLP